MTLVVVLSGPIAAGKTTLAWQLRDAYGAVVFGTRQLLLAHLGPGAGRANLQRLGETLDRETSGMWVADALNAELVQRGDVPIIVVDACRVREQVDAIRSAFSRVYHIHLTAPARVREARYSRRDPFDAGLSFEDASKDSTERQADSLSSVADLTIETDIVPEAAMLERIDANLEMP